MKYIFSFVGIVVVCLSFFFFKEEKTESNCLCVCVVSNSNSKNDENIKLAVKDKISSYLNKIAGAWSDSDVDYISFATNQLLSIYHCSYSCDVTVSDEKKSNWNFSNDSVCKIICITLGNGFGEKSWQMFYE